MFVNMEGIYFLAELFRDLRISNVYEDYILFVCLMHNNDQMVYCGKLVSKLEIDSAYCDIEEITEDEITRTCLDELCIGWAISEETFNRLNT